jgi:ABC-type phosphate transport system substrate-binding protein
MEMAELAGVLVGNYFLLECLAREGIVETYRARPTTRGGYDVALRLFRPEFPDVTSFRENFATEVEKVWRCHHKHIQSLLEFGAGADLLYCATLITDDETLEQYVQRQPEQLIPVPMVVRFVTQLCAALQYCHEQDIVHGNIQPSSILVDHEENVFLTQFGMRRAYQAGEPLVPLVEEGNAAYVAPEQSLGMSSPASDIYAIGVLLYRLLSGRLPYIGESAGEIALKHTEEPIPSLRALRPDISEALELVIRVALAKSPEGRFPSAAALAQALLSALAPGGRQIVTPLPERRIVVRARRTGFARSHTASFLMLSVLLFGLFGATIFIFSLPPHIFDIQGRPWSIGRSVFSPRTPVSQPTTPTALRGSPTVNAGNIYPPLHVTPTVVMSQTPAVNGTVGVTPTSSAIPAPSLFTCESGTLHIDGSVNFEPLLQHVNQDYHVQCPVMTISLAGDDSRTGLSFLQQKEIDVVSSDLTVRPSHNLTDQPIAAMLYTLIVNPDVQVSQLSSRAIQDIYQGRITNWSQVGGSDMPIKIIQRPANDTVSAVFQAFVLNNQGEHVNGARLKKNWLQAVAQTPGAISYVPLVVTQGANVTVLAIDGVSPTIQALVQGTYPFWSVEHFYTQGSGTSQFQSYLQFLMSEQEALAFPSYGAAPITMVPQEILATHLPGPEI